MMRNQILVLILLTIFALFLGSRPVEAFDIPNFPSCTNPQGTIKVTYPNGTHGIIGDSSEHQGSDSVYQLENGNLFQCFCSVDGAGIQTNWWKDSSLTSEQHQILLNSGWIFIPNGALWGLEETAYFAQNSSYSCLPGNSNTGGSSTTAGGGSGGGSGDGRSDGLGCASHDCSNQGNQGQVLGVSTNIGEVLGLASTGGSYLPYVLAVLGIFSILSGLLLGKKFSK